MQYVKVIKLRNIVIIKEEKQKQENKVKAKEREVIKK